MAILYKLVWGPGPSRSVPRFVPLVTNLIAALPGNRIVPLVTSDLAVASIRAGLLIPSRRSEYRLQPEIPTKKIPPKGGTPNKGYKGVADPQPRSRVGDESFGVVEEEQK